MFPKDFQAKLGVVSDGLYGPKTQTAIIEWFKWGGDLNQFLSHRTGKVSQRGLDDLVFSEGFETKAYQDTKGIWTIGVGHTAAAGEPIPKKGMVISEAEVWDIFARDIVKYEKEVVAILPNVPQHVFDGAVSFHYNTGGIAKASWPKYYKAGDMKKARQYFMQWNKPPEIIGRRTREAELIFEGKYVT